MWLYGTIHDAGAGDVPEAVWRVLADATTFVSELGDYEPDPKKVAALARLPWGEVLDKQLPPDDWWDLVNAMLGVMNEDELRHARPWFAVLRLVSNVARSPKPSMDVALADRARSHGIAVLHLESWEEQLGALAASVTVADLSRAIHERGALACQLADLRAAYHSNDAAALERMLTGTPSSAVLLGERNRRWLPQIERYLAGRGAFIAVGLGHLLGEEGLPAMLARAGYTVERTTGTP